MNHPGSGWEVLHTGLPENQAAASLIDGYLKMGHPQLRTGEREEEKGVLRGDLGFAEQCAQPASALAPRRNDLAAFEPVVEGLQENISQIRSALARHPGEIVVRPRAKPIPTQP